MNRKKISFSTADSGACCSRIDIELQGEQIKHIEFIGGCPGNHLGIQALVRGRTVSELIPLLKGIQCQNGTSCPDQLARALEAAAKH